MKNVIKFNKSIKLIHNLNSKCNIKNNLKKVTALLLIFSFLVSMSGCSLSKEDDGKLTIVTTLFSQYDFARQIVGDKGNVELLLSPGVEAHSYDPTPSDIIKINECDIFIYTGENMEVWAGEIIDSLENEVTVLDVSKGIELVKTEDEHKESHIHDPHIWTSPVMAITIIESILEEIVKADEKNADFYRKNAEKYIAEIMALDSEFRTLVNEADIKTIYFADKFAMYGFVKEYNLSYVSAYDSCSAETEPSAKLVAKMVDEVKKNNVKVIYYAELSNHKAADTISKETGAQELLLHSCHNVSKEEFAEGVTYLSLMRQNLENLKVGLYK